MKYFIFLFTLFTISLNAQNSLKFDKRNVQCEDKWIAYQMDKDSTYTFGFIYIDSQAGLTFNYEGKFKIEKDGKFNRLKSEFGNEVGFIKSRLQPNRIAIAEIPETKFKELNIEKTPKWLKVYKTDENSVDRLYRWGYMYIAACALSHRCSLRTLCLAFAISGAAALIISLLAAAFSPPWVEDWSGYFWRRGGFPAAATFGTVGGITLVACMLIDVAAHENTTTVSLLEATSPAPLATPTLTSDSAASPHTQSPHPTSPDPACSPPSVQ